eukprot:PhM_4_TR7605/c1_g1_i1/m.49382/K04460/PPP5C; serine/threonine-protein phosphatase 5
MSDARAEAEKHKALGNECFQKAHFTQAVTHYSDAINADPTVPAYYLNRALMYIRLECPGATLSDVDEALKLDPNLPKAYYRKAFANEMLGRHAEAITALKHCLSLCPEDTDAKNMLASCEKEVQRVKFLKAIATPDAKRPFEEMKYETMSVDASYTGPRVGDSDPIDLTFVEAMLDEFGAGRLIHRKYATRLMLEARALFAACPNVTPVEVPEGEEITVCGDIHGQFYDLRNIFKINGVPSTTNRYLFNGDVVDRGSYSVECFLTMMAYKILYPKHFFLSRGNHEGLNLNKVYGFEGEMVQKYSRELFDLSHDVFRALPLAHTINRKVFTVHGGLFSRDGVTIDEINKVSRSRDIPEDGLMCEMLWSDPQPLRGRAPNKRGVGVAFGPDVTEEFLKTNGLDLVVRSHEVKDDGYVVEHDGKCITVFSAPNYCDQLGNKGAFIRFKGGDLTPKFTTYVHVPHAGKKPMQYSPYSI